MGKLYLLVALTAGVLVASPAVAVMKCVKLVPNSSYTSTYNSNGYKVDWTASSSGVPIVGVSACASTAGTTVGQRASSLTKSSSLESNKYCWCKMVSPAVSSWVVPEGCTDAQCMFLTETNCRQYCAVFCARTGRSDQSSKSGDFLNALFSGLSD